MNVDPERQSGPSAALPAAVTARLRAEIDPIARQMTRRIGDLGGLPSDFRKVGYIRSILSACRDALGTLVRMLEDGHGLRAGDLDHLGSMGAEQAARGVPLELLLAAYRLAAKVVWQEVIGEAMRQQELDPTTVISVTERVLEYLDDISGAVGAAYLETRERMVRDRDRTRDRILVRLLAGDISADLRHLAAISDVELAPPYHVIAYRLADGDASHSDPRGVEDVWRRAGALGVAEPPNSWLVLLPATADVNSFCTDVLRQAEPSDHHPGARFGVGPTALTLADLSSSADRARAALDIGSRLEPSRHIHHDADLGVFAALATDPDAMDRFAHQVLGPLADHNQPRHAALLKTLAALLSHSNVSEAATALGVHRHTVVYRVGRLRDLGLDPDSAPQRPRLWLGLQCLRLLDRTP